MPLDTTIHSGFITDLVAPREGTCGRTAAELEQLSYDTALEILHDFPAFIRSSPLVTHVERIDASNPHFINVPAFRALFGLGGGGSSRYHDHSHNDEYDDDDNITDKDSNNTFIQYSITDKLSFFLGAVQSNLVFQSALRKTATGFESFTNPGSGVKMHGTFNLQRSPDIPGVVHFVERNETRCNVFLGVYIKATLGSSHKTLHENFKRAWNEALKRKLGAWGDNEEDAEAEAEEAEAEMKKGEQKKGNYVRGN